MIFRRRWFPVVIVCAIILIISLLPARGEEFGCNEAFVFIFKMALILMIVVFTPSILINPYEIKISENEIIVRRKLMKDIYIQLNEITELILVKNKYCQYIQICTFTEGDCEYFSIHFSLIRDADEMIEMIKKERRNDDSLLWMKPFHFRTVEIAR